MKLKDISFTAIIYMVVALVAYFSENWVAFWGATVLCALYGTREVVLTAISVSTEQIIEEMKKK